MAEFEKSFSEKAANDAIPPSEVPAVAQTSFPEGGRDAWMTVAGGWMVVFCTFGAIQSFAVYQDYHTRISLNEHPPSDVSWIGSVQVFLLFAGGIFSGKFLTRIFQAFARWRQFYLPALIVSAISCEAAQLLPKLSGTRSGHGNRHLIFALYLHTSPLLQETPRSCHGIIHSGSSVGAVCYPIMVNHLFNGKTGFAWGVRAVSFLDLGLLLAANAMMRTRLPRRSVEVDWSGIMRDVPYWLCLMGIFFAFWGLYVPIFYIQLYAVKNGASKVLQTYDFWSNGAHVLLRLVGPFIVIIPVTFISGCLAFAFLGARSDGGLTVFALFYGFFSGGLVSVSAPASALFSRNVREIGTRIGLMCFVSSFGLLTGNPISGAILHPPRYTWVQPIIFSGVTVLAGFCFLLLSTIRRPKN
ncbi:major facilitator superfamily domain-containing protein [Mycena sp. CBHHK59/15]|nr:major facilitator superfamily domain-containing protein [Mycena sp. CBHHK59/15]